MLRAGKDQCCTFILQQRVSLQMNICSSVNCEYANFWLFIVESLVDVMGVASKHDLSLIST